MSGTSASWYIGDQLGKRRDRKKETGRVGAKIIIQIARKLFRSRATCKLLQPLLIDDAAIKISRALTGVDRSSNNQPVSLMCLMTCLISEEGLPRPQCSKVVLGMGKDTL